MAERGVAARAQRQARRMNASPKVRKALELAGIVESGNQHAKYSRVGSGDRDSVGFLQQRPSQGWGKAGESVETDAAQFIRAANKIKGKYGSAHALAQGVQRSGFPDRYRQVSGQAKAYRVGGAAGAPSSAPQKARRTKGKSYEPERAEARRGLLTGDITMKSLLAYKQAVSELEDVPGRVIKGKPAGKKVRPSSSGGGGKNDGMGKGDIVEIGKLAQSMGLRAGEHSQFGGKPTGGHAPKSNHYIDKAVDVSGDPAKMRKFARKVNARYGKTLAELFWNGPGAVNRKDGKRVPKGFVSGHDTHVHVAKK